MSANDKPAEPTESAAARRIVAAAQAEVSAFNREAADTSARGAAESLASDALLAHSFAGSVAGCEVIREVHRGGQGVVYEATQRSTGRRVAIKVMREGPFAGPSDRHRFEREVQILGQLQHPNIVTIHDCGIAAGSHYFVMDYIEGEPLDIYAVNRRLSVAEALRLFLKVCDAVNAAHLRGVIHRDLKPGNVRVDAAGEPHVLDFGLAKLISPSPSKGEGRGEDGDGWGEGASVLTETGQFIGSLQWASPEQAEGAPGKIDVRTDVYALGVIFYHMLTGRFPYDVFGSARDVLDSILQADPVRPSAVNRLIDDEIETIILKCLQKDRERRYQSAGELARDLRHYLAGEPIEAKRDSTWYVLRKQVRRHRGAVVASSLMLALSVTLVVALVLRHAYRDLGERRRRDQYVHLIALADGKFGANDIASMQESLGSCPTDLRGWEWHYLNRLSDQSIATLDGREVGSWDINCVAFSPDQTRLAGADIHGNVLIWDLNLVPPAARRLGTCGKLVGSLAFNPDGTRLVSGGSAGVNLWNVTSGDHTCLAEAGTPAAFSPDGAHVVWRDAHGMTVSDLAGGRRECVKPGEFDSVAFNRGSTVVALARGEDVEILDARNWSTMATLVAGPGTSVRMAFSGDSLRLATGLEDGSVTVWDRRTGARVRVIEGGEKELTSIALSADGHQLATTGRDKALKIWDLADGSVRALHGHTVGIDALSFSPDGRRIASAGRECLVKLWDANAPECKRDVRSRRGSFVRAVGDQYAIVWDRAGPYQVLDLLTGAELGGFRGLAPVAASVSSDGLKVAVGHGDGAVTLCNLANASQRSLSGHTMRVECVAFNPRGTKLATGGGDDTVRVWDVATRDCEFVLAHDPASDAEGRDEFGGVRGVAWSLDARLIASASFDRTVRIWDSETGHCLHVLRDYPYFAMAVTFSRDRRRVVAGGAGGQLMMWNTDTGRLLRKWRGDPMDVYSVAFSPDRDRARIISGGADGAIRVWDPDRDECLITLRPGAEIFNSVAFSSDGTRILAMSDGGVAIWDAGSGAAVSPAK